MQLDTDAVVSSWSVIDSDAMVQTSSPHVLYDWIISHGSDRSERHTNELLSLSNMLGGVRGDFAPTHARISTSNSCQITESVSPRENVDI